MLTPEQKEQIKREAIGHIVGVVLQESEEDIRIANWCAENPDKATESPEYWLEMARVDEEIANVLQKHYGIKVDIDDD